MKKLPLLAAASIIAFAGAASADEPVALQDSQLDNVTAGMLTFGFGYSKNITGNVYESYSTSVNLDGWTAEATAEANALSDDNNDYTDAKIGVVSSTETANPIGPGAWSYSGAAGFSVSVIQDNCACD